MKVRTPAGFCALASLVTGLSACNISATPNPTPTSPISATPGTLTFLQPTSANQQFVVSDKNFTGTFTASNNCAAVASVTAQSNPPVGPSATWNVVPVSGGTCAVTISDGVGTTMVTITVDGPLSVNPTSVSFPSNSSVAQSISVSAFGYTGTFSESDTCLGSGIATVSPAGPTAAPGPSATFTMTPLRVGTCAVTFGSTFNQSIVVPVSVL
jgi:hypothetical protein